MNDSLISFQKIYRKYSKDVYKFAFYLSGNADDAKDICSECFIRIWTSKDTIELDTVKAYLFTIARNLYLQKVRNQKTNIDIDTNTLDPKPRPDKISEDRSELQKILEAMQKLPEIDRMALLMKAHDGLSYQDISRVLGLSVSAIKVKIHRARLKLALLRSSEEER